MKEKKTIRKKREVVDMMLTGAERTSLVTDRMKRLYDDGREGSKEGQKETVSPEGRAAETVQERIGRTPQESVRVARTVSRTSARVQRVKEVWAKRTERLGQNVPSGERMKADVLKKAGQGGQNVVKESKKGITKAKEAVIASAKAVYRGIKLSAALIGALGETVVILILVVCMVGMIFGSAFGIFLTETGQGERTIHTVMYELDAEYDQQIAEMQESVEYGILEMHGVRPEWKEVLAVYAVKINLDPNDPYELITMTNRKEQMLQDIYWDMCNISSKVETEKRLVTTTVIDKDGKETEKKEIKDVEVLTIWTDCATAEEMAGRYFFNGEQRELLKALMDGGNYLFWAVYFLHLNNFNVA